MRYLLIAAMALMLAACGSAEAVSSPTPLPTPTAVPTPAPTPRTVTVEVVPQECSDAIFGLQHELLDYQDPFLAILHAYSDYPDENLAEFGKRAEDIIAALPKPDTALTDKTVQAIDACYAKGG